MKTKKCKKEDIFQFHKERIEKQRSKEVKFFNPIIRKFENFF